MLFTLFFTRTNVIEGGWQPHGLKLKKILYVEMHREVRNIVDDFSLIYLVDSLLTMFNAPLVSYFV